MLVKMSYYNKHEIDFKTYENQHIREGRDESDAEVLERVTGYKFMGIEEGYVKLMSAAGEVVKAFNRASLFDTYWNLVFEIRE